MPAFVTGATGLVGSAIVQELIGTGHQVLGFARSEKAAKELVAAGAELHCGSLEDLESLRSGAAAANGVIHTAFIHDFSNYGPAVEADSRATEILGGTPAGSDRPLIVTSGTLLAQRQGSLATEEDGPKRMGPLPIFLASRRRRRLRWVHAASAHLCCVFLHRSTAPMITALRPA